MFEYSKSSQAVYDELHPKLQAILLVVKRYWNHTLLDGKRTQAEQEKNVAKGVSKTMDSKHLPRDRDGHINFETGEAWAVDAMPYPIDWDAVELGLNALKVLKTKTPNYMAVLEAYKFSGFIAGVAAAQGTLVRQGTDWDGDNQFEEHNFIDIPHTELKGGEAT